MNSNILLQIERTTGSFIPPGAPVIFENSVYSSGDILYMSDTGTVIINQTGRYLVEWWISTQSSKSTEGIVFSISGTNLSSTTPILGTSPIKTGETVGLAIVEATDTPAVLSLINNSGYNVWLSSFVPVKAGLRIHSHHELENLDDGNALGSLIGIGAARGYTMGNYAVALGIETIASGDYSYAEGYGSQSTGIASHAQGGETHATSIFSHAEGYQTTSSGNYSHAEGNNTQSAGSASHAEGNRSQALGEYSHAEGSGTISSGISSHAEGDATEASGYLSHAEGFQTTASEWASHAEGNNTQALAGSSHAEGYYTTASGAYSHAEGEFTSTNLHLGSHIMGKYGEADMDYSWFLANGTDSSNQGLAAKIQSDGNAYIDIAWNSGGADYAEMFETSDGNTIPPGYFVTFDLGKKIRILNGDIDQYILGISSAVPAVLGNSGELRWKGKYETDDWGQIKYQDVAIPAKTNEDGTILIPEYVVRQPVLNPEWNPDAVYIPRRQRPEWIAVGLLGQILVRDDGTCMAGGYCRPNGSGIATMSESGYRVLERSGSHQVLIMFK